METPKPKPPSPIVARTINAVRATMERRNHTYKDVAARIGKHPQQVRDWLTGHKKEPRADNLALLDQYAYLPDATP